MIKNNLAPIVLFVYNRPDHTRKTIEALQKNFLAAESDLFIYSDAAKKSSEEFRVECVRKLIDKTSGFKTVTIIKREKNCGLAASVIDGVTAACKQYGKVIVLEDDLLTSPLFLKFMNEGLDKYKDQSNVFSITGYSFTDGIANIDETYFLSLTSTWGWGTWQDKWQFFQRDKEELEKALRDKHFRDSFNYENSYSYVNMAKKQLKGNSDSWGIFWYFTSFKNKGLILYPSKTMINNIGHDGSGTHCMVNKTETISLTTLPVFTDEIIEKLEIKSILQQILKSERKVHFENKVKAFIKYKIKTTFSMRTISTIMQVQYTLRRVFSKSILGKNSYIAPTVRILGKSHCQIGNSTVISDDSWLNINNKQNKTEKQLIIGNNCYIGIRNFFSVGKKISVGDFCLSAADCKFLCGNHKIHDPFTPYATTGVTDNQEIKIGANVWLGASTVVIGHVAVGHGSIIGAGSMVTKDIPPFSIAVGNPCTVIKRFDFILSEWVKVEDYELEHIQYIPTEEQYLEILNSKNPAVLFPLQAVSRNYGDLL